MRIKNKFKRIQAAKKANHISVKWKIFLFLLGFCGVLLVLLWLSQVVFLDNFYKSIKVNEIKTAASTIEKNIDSESISSIVSSISVNNDICIEVLSSSGEVLYSSHVLKDCLIHNEARFSDDNSISSGSGKTNGESYQFYKYNEADTTDIVAAAPNGAAATTDAASTNDPSLNPDQKEPIPDKIAREKENIIYTKSIKDANNNDVTLVLNSVVSPVNATVNTSLPL